jgi:hypothetical protein
MNLPTASTKTPGWFKHRLPASKRILDEMTSEDRRKFEEEAKNYEIEGLPTEVQRK